ncbi:MAG: HlyD family secretion protein [Methylococcales bacterium]|nr:HlyD family secretion protein [Methylococcales bacterium]
MTSINDDKQPALSQTKVEKNSASSSSDQQDTGETDPVRRLTVTRLLLCIFMFILYVVADRLTPYTDLARIKAFVLPIVPEVAGNVSQVNVDSNQVVKAGEVLIQIDTTRYELAVKSAKANLDLAGQDVGASTAGIVSAQVNLANASAQAKHIQAQYNRIMPLVKKGVISQSDGDKTIAALIDAKAKVNTARAELEKVQLQLGQKGQDNAAIKAALANLEQAQLDLTDTTIKAPIDGVISNVQIDAGHYAQTGQAIMSMISITDVWIEASMRENSLGNIDAGDNVEIALDSAPGEIFDGEIISVGYGVHEDTDGSLGTLQKVQKAQGWLRDPQRFAVVIKITEKDHNTIGLQRAGGQADVIVYTGEHLFVNLLGSLWIRIISYFSYVY